MNKNGIIDAQSEGKNANEVVYFNDGRMTPKSNSFAYVIIKRVFVIALIVFGLICLIFGKGVSSEITGSMCVCFLIILTYLIKNGGHERVECPSELWFYDDFMIFLVPKCHVRINKDQMESQKIYYKDVTKCQFRTNTRRMVICGMMDEIHYRYDKTGSIEKKPNYQRRYDGMIYFYTVFDFEHDFKEIIERNTPLTVEYQDA